MSNTFPNDIAKARAHERAEGVSIEERQVKALEHIADTLESLRISIHMIGQMQANLQSRQSSYSPQRP